MYSMRRNSETPPAPERDYPEGEKIYVNTSKGLVDIESILGHKEILSLTDVLVFLEYDPIKHDPGGPKAP